MPGSEPNSPTSKELTQEEKLQKLEQERRRALQRQLKAQQQRRDTMETLEKVATVATVGGYFFFPILTLPAAVTYAASKVEELNRQDDIDKTVEALTEAGDTNVEDTKKDILHVPDKKELGQAAKAFAEGATKAGKSVAQGSAQLLQSGLGLLAKLSKKKEEEEEDEEETLERGPSNG